jgi:hypothetical protein
LHSLERSVRKRKAHAASRAFKVLRMEGGAATQVPEKRASLPKDLEAQVAVVRGRAIGTPSRGLLQLERRLLQPASDLPPPAPLTYSRAAPRQKAAPVALSLGVPSEVEPPASTFGDALAGRFDVEAFDAPSPLPRPLALAAAVSRPPPAPRPAPAPQRAAADADAEALAATFERDLEQVIGASAPAASANEDKQWDERLRSARDAAALPPPQAPTAAPATPAAARAPGNAHDVFNDMGLAMDYANRFDLGAVDLAQRFDQFDAELAVSPSGAARAQPVKVEALALDDVDLVADLADLAGGPAAGADAVAAARQEPDSLEKPGSSP